MSLLVVNGGDILLVTANETRSLLKGNYGFRLASLTQMSHLTIRAAETLQQVYLI